MPKNELTHMQGVKKFVEQTLTNDLMFGNDTFSKYSKSKNKKLRLSKHKYCKCNIYQYYYYIQGLKAFIRCQDVAKDLNIRGTSSMDCRERGSNARGVYPTQYTSRMETAKVEEEEGADRRIIVKE